MYTQLPLTSDKMLTFAGFFRSCEFDIHQYRLYVTGLTYLDLKPKELLHATIS